MKGIRDIDQFYRKLAANKVTPRDIARLWDDLVKLKDAFDTVSSSSKLRDSMTFEGILCSNDIATLIHTFDSNFSKDKDEIDDVSEEKLGLMTPEDACFVKRSAAVNDIQSAFDSSLDYDQSLGSIQEYFCSLLSKYEKEYNYIHQDT